VLLESVEHLDATAIVEDEAEAKYEGKRQRPGHRRSRTEGGATGYAAVWKKNQTWKGLKVHMGLAQEAYDAECAVIARAHETAARRRNKLDHLTIFTDAPAAIWRVTSDDPGPGTAIRHRGKGTHRGTPPQGARDPDRYTMVPSHCWVEGNENADEWAMQAADEPDARGVEWH